MHRWEILDPVTPQPVPGAALHTPAPPAHHTITDRMETPSGYLYRTRCFGKGSAIHDVPSVAMVFVPHADVYSGQAIDALGLGEQAPPLGDAH